MPVSSKHPDYQRHVFQWQKCRDCVIGEDAVKAANAIYLPELTGQNEPMYQAYKHRASFYSASGRTVKGLAGAILRKEPVVEFPTPEFMLDVGPRGETVGHVIKNVVEQVITTGRCGVLVDSDQSDENPDGQPYITLYDPETIINWGEEVIEGRRQLTLLVLQETAPIRDDGNDPFEWEENKERYRVFTLENWDSPDPFLKVQLWEKVQGDDDDKESADEDSADPYKGFVLLSEVMPRFFGGKSVYYIPFVFINPGTNGPEIESSPILDLVNMNLSHYVNSADHEHGLHFTALPTPWISGVDNTTVLRIGSESAWTLPAPESRCGMLEFSGAGLGAIADTMKAKEEKMAILGARLLEAQKVAQEAAAAIALRHSGEESILSNIVHSINEGLTTALTWLAEWLGQGDQQVSVELNDDFDSGGIDFQTLQQLMFAVQGGLISWDTWFTNLKRGELIPDGRSPDEEKALIELGNPQGPTPPAASAGGMGAMGGAGGM